MGTSLAVADTSLFVALENDRPLRAEPPERFTVSMITVAELRAGVLAAGDPESLMTCRWPPRTVTTTTYPA